MLKIEWHPAENVGCCFIVNNKFQLMCLIALFAIGIFAPEEVTSQQGDFINVLTWFTVLMLYWDKRKPGNRHRSVLPDCTRKEN